MGLWGDGIPSERMAGRQVREVRWARVGLGGPHRWHVRRTRLRLGRTRFGVSSRWAEDRAASLSSCGGHHCCCCGGTRGVVVIIRIAAAVGTVVVAADVLKAGYKKRKKLGAHL
jgi:hypothetical protein